MSRLMQSQRPWPRRNKNFKSDYYLTFLPYRIVSMCRQQDMWCQGHTFKPGILTMRFSVTCTING